ncbi:hypothetical protein V1514DRAFT_339008 [Lipomyces japonicus]|uniref:uncharacterized protein n=1 Tax=Lipomyces japonicus TaxID=56871 RepID=UPI0034CF30D8
MAGLTTASATGTQPSSTEFAGPDTGTRATTSTTIAAGSGFNELDQERIKAILNSDVGVNILLKRLKQSIVSGRDYAAFLKRRASLEEEHAQSLKRLVRSSQEAIRKPDGRQDSFSSHFDEATRVHEQLAEHSNKFASELNKMYDDLSDLCKSTEKARKVLKETGLRNEKNVIDAEQAAEKTKGKYDSLCDEFDRVRIGDPSKRSVGLKFKSNKTGPQHEEELHKKVLAADADYKLKVQTAKNLLNDLLKILRPDTVRQLRNLLASFDAGLALHFQRYSNISEVLSLSNGLTVSPMKKGSVIPRSLTQIANEVDNDHDTYEFILKQGSGAVLRRPEIEYKQHKALAESYKRSPSRSTLTSTGSAKTTARQIPPSRANEQQARPSAAVATAAVATGVAAVNATPSLKGQTSSYTTQSRLSEENQLSGSSIPVVPVPLATQTSFSEAAIPSQASTGLQQYNGESNGGGGGNGAIRSHIFGVPLDFLMEQERSRLNIETVVAPVIVIKCIEAIDKFGLDTEGIYRVNGTASEIEYLQNVFETGDPFLVDFGNRSTFHNDVHAVASLLKLYFRELPNPLLTSEMYSDMVSASKIADDNNRRDALHLLINDLPDANYTTLKYLVFHLYRVQDRFAANRMSITNLAVVWGPSLLGGNARDAQAHGVIVETILANCYSIFDPD